MGEIELIFITTAIRYATKLLRKATWILDWVHGVQTFEQVRLGTSNDVWDICLCLQTVKRVVSPFVNQSSVILFVLTTTHIKSCFCDVKFRKRCVDKALSAVEKDNTRRKAVKEGTTSSWHLEAFYRKFLHIPVSKTAISAFWGIGCNITAQNLTS